MGSTRLPLRDQVMQGQVVSLAQRLADYEFFQVYWCDPGDGRGGAAVIEKPFALQGVLDVPAGARVDRELAAADRYRQHPARRLVQRGALWLRVAQEVGCCLVQLPSLIQEEFLDVPAERGDVGVLAGREGDLGGEPGVLG